MDNQLHTPQPPQTNAASTPPTLAPAAPTPILTPLPEPKHHDSLKSIISTLAILIIAPLIALSLTAFVFQPYEVDGLSMETTLQNNDRLIVLKVPRTWAKITRHSYIPSRGDIIIFNKQSLYALESIEKKQLIKRVIALPGERITVKDGVITVFNKEYPKGFQPDKTLPYGGTIGTTPGEIDLIVPDNEVFVSGDNRTNSLDSRAPGFGTVPTKDIVGKLGMRIFPFNKAKLF